MIIIGEKINSSIPSVAGAIEKKDAAYIEKLARDQVTAGASFIDVNAGAFLAREIELLIWLVKVVQEAVDAPLCLDSPNAEAIAAVLPLVRRKAIINSISAEEERYRGVIPLVKQYQSSVIALCMDDRGIPSDTGRRVEIARALVKRLESDGIKREDIYLDAMVQPIGTDMNSGLAALEAVRIMKETLPGVHFTCGLSNVSFGLPKRKLLNQAYAVALAAYGMDTMFIDPLDERMMALLTAIETLVGRDDFCCDYLAAYRAGKLG